MPLPQIPPPPVKHMSAQQQKEHYWQHRGVIAHFLWPLSLIFCLISTIRRYWLTHICSPWQAPVPVVVVGNLTAGGAGKTPTTIALIQHLQKLGHKPGVVSRGYGRKNPSACLEVSLHSSPEQVGDEPLLIQSTTEAPVFVAAERKKAVQALLSRHPDITIILCDDGLQHYALARQIEIAVFDERGAGNNWLIPAGPLREPLHRARDVDLILFNTDCPPALPVQLPGYTVKRRLGGYLPLQTWAQTPAPQRCWKPMHELVQQQQNHSTTISAAAGIGHPQRFFNMLVQEHITLEEVLPLADHFDFADSPFDTIHSDMVLITEKDATKCLQLRHTQHLFVVTLDYVPETAFFEHFDNLLKAACTKHENKTAAN